MFCLISGWNAYKYGHESAVQNTILFLWISDQLGGRCDGILGDKWRKVLVERSLDQIKEREGGADLDLSRFLGQFPD